MKLTLIAAGLVGATVATASADTTYSTLSDWDGSRRSENFGRVAQTVTVPATDTTLDFFSFYSYTDNIEASYRVLVYEWNDAMNYVEGAPVYEGESAAMTPGEFALETELIEVDLVAESTYALMIQFSESTETTGAGYVRPLEGQENFYEGGFMAATNGSVNSAWTVFGRNDLAFETQFSGATPAPGALSLLGLGVCFGAGRRRRA